MPKKEIQNSRDRNCASCVRQKVVVVCGALLAQGRNKDEAFGVVIGEFGSVEELKAQMQEDLAAGRRYHGI